MKIVGRILIILAAALVVVGATVAFSNTGLARRLVPGFPDDRFAPDDEFPRGEGGFARGNFGRTIPEGEFSKGTLPGGRFRPEGRLGGGFDLGFSLLTWGRHLGIMGIIVLMVVLLDRVGPRVHDKLRKLLRDRYPS